MADLTPIHGCSGCATTAGRLGCGVHGPSAKSATITMPAMMMTSADANYEAALRCKRCHHFLLPHEIEGHERWHDEPRR